MNPKTKILLFVVAIGNLFQGLQAQTLYDIFEDDRPFIGTSAKNTLNINSPSGTLYQDIKRSVGLIWLYIDENDEYDEPITFRNFVILNNTSHDKRPFVLLSALEHNFSSYLHNKLDPSDSDDSKVLNAYATLDYEFPHASEQGDDEDDAYIGTVYRIKLKVRAVLRDAIMGYALLEIINDDVSNDTDEDELLDNAYAAGFSISANPTTNRYVFVGHSGKDHKKLSAEFTAQSRSEISDDAGTHEEVTYLRSLFFKIDGEEPGFIVGDNVNAASPTFNTDFQFIGFSSFDPEISSLVGAWYKDQEKVLGLLDTNDTHITSVPGGYLNHLMYQKRQQLLMPLHKGQRVKTPGIDQNNPTTLEEGVLMIKPGLLFANVINGNEPSNEWLKLDPGIKKDEIIRASKVVMSVFHLEKSNSDGSYIRRLIYGGYIDNPFHQSDREFRGKGWNCDESSEEFEPCNRLQPNGVVGVGMSTDYIPSYFNAAINQALQRSQDGSIITYPMELAIPIQVELKNIGDNPENIVAVRYPGEVATNALQLFDPEEFETEFNYYQYKDHRGENSNNIYIDEVLFNEQRLSSDGWKKSTGNNGGYLNLVNPVHKIGPISTSISLEEEERTVFYITLKIHNPENNPIKYGAWIDYNDVINQEDNTFNFVDDGEIKSYIEDLKHKQNYPNVEENESLIVLESSKPNEVILGVTIPTAERIDALAAGESLITRLRVGVYSEESITTDFPLPHGTFAEGEVEDYMIEIRAPTAEEILKRKAKIALENKRKKRIKLPDKPDDVSEGNDMLEAASDLLYFYNSNSQQNNANAFALAFGFENLGSSLKNVFSPALFSTQQILSLENLNFGATNGDDSDDAGKSCPNNPNPNNDPYDFSPNDAQTWPNWSQLNRLYKNIGRIMHWWRNLRLDPSQPPVAFVGDELDNPEIWNLFLTVRNYYNQVELFKNLIEGKATVYELLYLVFSYNQNYFLRTAYQAYPNLVTTIIELYKYYLKFQCFKDQLLTAENEFEKVVNFSKNSARIGVDMWGQVIPEVRKIRDWVNKIRLTQLPEGGASQVLLSIKDDNNSETVVLNASRQLEYTLTVGEKTKTITSPVLDENQLLNKEIYITNRFNEGVMELYFNETKLVEGTIDDVKEFGYPNNFTAVNNGARIGAPVFNFTDSNVNAGLIPLEGEWYNTWYLDETNPLTDNELKNLVLENNNTQQQNFSSGFTKNNLGTKEPNALQVAASQKTTTFSIFPNPAKDELNILVEVERAGALSVNIFDLAGKQVYKLKEAVIKEGHQLIGLRKLKFSAGQYIVKVKAGNVTQSEQVVFE